LHTPAGTLALTEHPLFGQGGQFLASDLVIMDTADLKYRHLTGADTTLLKNREENGTDGAAEEYLTECGLEIHHKENFHRLNGILAAAADD